MKNQSIIFIASLILIMGMLVHGENAVGKYIHPTEFIAQSTTDLLNEIDAASAKPATGNESTATLQKQHRSLWMQFAPMLLTAGAIGIAGSICGLFVILRKEAIIALAMPQAVAVGAAIAMRMGWPTLPPAMLVAGIAMFYLIGARRMDLGLSVLPSIYVGGLSISFLLIADKGQELTHLQNLFVGIDVAVTTETARWICPLLLLTGALCAALWRRWLLLSQAPATAELSGLHPARWHAAFLILLTLVLLLGTSAMGVLITLAMLFLPAAIVLPFSRRIPQAMLAGCVVSIALVAGAFPISNSMNWPYSQTVGGMGFMILVLSSLLPGK